MMTSEKVSRLTRCHQWTKHWPSAVLLYRIFYWHPRTKLEKDGKMWIAKSRSDWGVECDLSDDEVKNAVERLKKAGIILTRQGLWRNRNILHISLVEHYYFRLRQAETNDAFLGSHSPPEQGLTAPHQVGSQNPTPITGSLDKEVIQDPILTDQIEAHGCAYPQEAGADPEDQEQEVHMVKKFGSVAEALAASVKPVVPEGSKALTVPADILWKEEVHKATGKFVPELTIAQRAQLKAVMKTCPGNSGHAVLRRVVADWTGFVLQVKNEAGISQVPNAPSIGFLRKYVGIAINFKTSDKPEQPVLTPVSKKVPVQAPKPQPKSSEKASLSEVLAIIGGSPKKV